MNDELVRLAIAARAAGEDLPGVDRATLDRRVREDAALAAESEDLVRVVALLRGPGVPADERRVRAVEARLRARPGARLGWVAAAAAVLVVAAGAALVARSRTERPPSVAREVGAAPFAEAVRSLRDVAWREIGPAPPAGLGGEPRRAAAPARARAGLLVPFAAQADFTVLALPEPSALRVVEARFRRATAGVRPQSVAWIVYSTPRGPLALLETADAPGADAIVRALDLPEGWRSVVRRDDGTIVVVASPGMDAGALETVAASLAPVAR